MSHCEAEFGGHEGRRRDRRRISRGEREIEEEEGWKKRRPIERERRGGGREEGRGGRGKKPFPKQLFHCQRAVQCLHSVNESSVKPFSCHCSIMFCSTKGHRVLSRSQTGEPVLSLGTGLVSKHSVDTEPGY